VTQPVSCPDPGDLKRLAHGTLSVSEAEALRHHVLDCSGCARLLQSFHADDPFVTALPTRSSMVDVQSPAPGPTHRSAAQDKFQTVQDFVDELARKRFEAALLAGRPEPIDHFLPPPNAPQYLGTLVELVHIELEFAWKRWEPSDTDTGPDHQPPLLEAYLKRFPDLESPTILRDLVEAEWLLRHRHGDRPSPDEYQVRFPNLVDAKDLEGLKQRGGFVTATPEVPGFEILGELGRGGMGVVYKARQTALKRMVALKMILAGAHTSGADLARFRSEAEAVARLRHPNIVQVYEIGELKGLPFFSLEYVDGGTLAGKVNGAPLPERQAAQVVETLARAMHEAHQSGIVHRDLKPANVLLTAAGAVKIADFGLAKKLDEAGQTTTGAIMGTPSYMAPEQARGDLREIGPATDIYALGGILYELLTGRPPFRGSTKIETLWQVLHQEPIPPSRLQPGVTRDLENVCLKCLEKEPGRRYGSAETLAEDLRRFQAGEPTRARPVGRLERGWKWAKRRPVAAGLLAVSTLLLLALVGLTVGWFYHGKVEAALGLAETALEDAERQRTAAQLAREEALANARVADREKNRAEMLSYLLGVQAAHHAWQSNDVPAALVYLDQWRAWERRGWEFDYVRSLCSGSRLTLKGHTGPVKNLAMSADGKRIVSGGSWDQTVKVWNADSGQEVLSFRPHAANIFGVAISGDGKRIVTTGNDLTVNVWDAATAQKVRSIQGRLHQFSCLGLSADGKRIVAGSCVFTPQGISLPGEMQVMDADTGVDIFLLKGHTSGISSVAFSADSKRIVSGSQDGTVKIWDAEKGKDMLTLKGHSGAVTSAAITRDGQRIVSCSADGTVKVWDALTGRQGLTLTGHTGVVQSVAISSDGQRIFSGSSDQTVKVWDGTSGEQLLTLKGHTDAVLSLAISADATRIASGSSDKTVRVWDAARNPEALTIKGHTDSLSGVAISPDGKRIVSGGKDGMVKVWDAGTGQALHSSKAPSGWVTSVAFSGDGKRIAAGNWDGSIQVWDGALGEPNLTIKGNPRAILTLIFSPDSKRLVSARDGTVYVWDATRGGEQLAHMEHGGLVTRVALSSDGKRIVSANQNGTIKVWDAATGQEILTIRGHPEGIHALAISSDGTRIISGGHDRMVKVWDALTGQSLLTLTGHTQPIQCVAISGDGRRIVSGSSDRTVKMWDAETGQEALTLKVLATGVNSVAWSGDGQTIVCGLDTTIKVWHVGRSQP
jgi:eukaryotic-like serine/threonine-protein kinase